MVVRYPVLARLPAALIALSLLAGSAWAQAPAGPAVSAAELDRVAGILRDDARRAELLRTLDALTAAARAGGPTSTPPPAEATPPEPTVTEALIVPGTVGFQLLRGLADRIGHVIDGAGAAARSMADLPSLWRGIAGLGRDPVARARLFDGWKLLLTLGAALLLEHLIWRALRRPRARLDSLAPAPGEAWGWLKRLPPVLGRLLLDLVPVAGFALVGFGVLGTLQPLPTTQLVGLMAAQVYIGARIAFALARLLLSPRSAQLRLLPCSDATAWYCVRWLRRLLLVGLSGYALAEAGQEIGLSWAAYDAILNVTLLLISLLLVRIVLQTRERVATALRADPLAPGDRPDSGRRMLRAARDRLAAIWHVLAILWLLALWTVWALAIEDGFGRLLRGSAVVIAAAVAAKLLDEGARRLLDRLLPVDGNGAAARAGSYLPALRAVLSGAIAVAAAFAVLEFWGFAALGWFAEGTLGGRLLAALASIGVTIVVALVVWEVTNTAIQRRLSRLARDTQAARSARVRTLLPMLRTVLGLVILVFTVLSALTQIGVNVAPLLAGAGVVGVAVGFGSQTLVRDVITGVFLLLEDAMAVGDVVTLGGLSGVVEQLTIRSIKLRALDGSVHIVPFSAVTTVTNMTRDFSFAVLDVTVGYGEDTDRVADVLRRIGAEMQADPKWGAVIRDEIDVWGVEKLADYGVMIRARVKADPSARWNVARELNRRVIRRFEELGIDLPTPRQQLVFESAPVAPPLAPPQARAAE